MKMKLSHYSLLLLPAFAAGLSVMIAVTLSSQPTPQSVPTAAERALQAQCLDCHAEQAKTLTGTPHAPSQTSSDNLVSCLDCHRDRAQEHIDDPYGASIASPAQGSPAVQQAVCGRCHLAHVELDQIGFDAHLSAAVACSDCHTVHSQNLALTKDPDLAFCGRCHPAVLADLQHRSSHPLGSGGMTCLSCHNFTGRGEPAASGGGQYRCLNCHAEESGPFRHDHAGSTGFAVGSESCISCHQPHGSNNPAMLTRTGNQLCMQCHVIPVGHRTAHDGVAMSATCLDCHSAIHGSNESRQLLAENMATRVNSTLASCFCHETRE